MNIAALIVAAGRGTRAAGAGLPPKQYARIGGIPVLGHTLSAFAECPFVRDIQVVIHPDDAEFYRESLPGGAANIWPPVPGGANRQASVLAGLEALSALAPDAVLIHDAARPFVDAGTIERTISALKVCDGAIAAVPLADTLKRAGDGGAIAGTIDRNGLWCAQTPQAFRFNVILDAHRRAAAAERENFTDDAALAEWAGITVQLVEGSRDNFKLTTADDLASAELRLQRRAAFETRTASGFDVHRFADGDHVWLGGVRIAHDKRLDGHSDADVALHALTDALLGTIGAGDIGQHFPPSDARWKGARSIIFLEHAASLVAARGGRIVNVDITILAEAPKVGPHREDMQKVIGAALGLAADRIGIKATTTEGLGFTGRREGIAAMATATVQLPAAG